MRAATIVVFAFSGTCPAAISRDVTAEREHASAAWKCRPPERAERALIHRRKAFYNTLDAMLGMLTSVFLLCALTCSGQVITSLHPAAAYPGDWLQFRGDRKLTGRSRLVGNIAPPSVASAYAGAPRRATLPNLSFSSAVVNLSSFTNGSMVNQAANVALKNVKTSDGLSFSSFGFTLI